MKYSVLTLFLILTLSQATQSGYINALEKSMANRQQQGLPLKCDLSIIETVKLIRDTYEDIIHNKFTLSEYITFLDKMVKDFTHISKVCKGNFEEILEGILHFLKDKHEKQCIEKVFQVLDQGGKVIEKLNEGKLIFVLPQIQKLINDTSATVAFCTENSEMKGYYLDVEQEKKCNDTLQSSIPELIKMFEAGEIGFMSMLSLLPMYTSFSSNCVTPLMENYKTVNTEAKTD